MKIKNLIIFFTSAYLLNFFWESWHAVYLYQGHMGKSFNAFSVKEYLSLIGYVSLIDALILLSVFLVGAFFWKGLSWFNKPDAAKIIYVLAAGLLVAAFIEIKGVYILEQWSYGNSMPTVFGLGLSPLLQLPTTALVSFFLIKKLNL